jgi:hypothetical protein
MLARLTTAPTLSQFAGLLAGFVFTAIVILPGSQLPASFRTRSLALLYVAFLILALDSFVFAQVGAEPSRCARNWTTWILASGLLQVGVVALVCGLGWLLLAHVDDRG